jgi:hypothetical protein
MVPIGTKSSDDGLRMHGNNYRYAPVPLQTGQRAFTVANSLPEPSQRLHDLPSSLPAPLQSGQVMGLTFEAVPLPWHRGQLLSVEEGDDNADSRF